MDELLVSKNGFVLKYANTKLQLLWSAATGLSDCDAYHDARLNNAIDLRLTCSPSFVVHKLVLNTSGSAVVLVGECDAVVCLLPKGIWNRPLHEFSEDLLCQCDQLDTDYYSRPLRSFSVGRRKIRILKVLWHPGSESDRLIVIMRSDNVVSIYSIEMPDYCLQKIFLSSGSDYLNESSGFPTKDSLGEAAVSFDFGPPRKIPFGLSLRSVRASKQPYKVWPLFALFGNGDIYMVLTDPQYLNEFPVTGPLTMLPASDDNYGVDACSVLLLKTCVPVLVVASQEGMLYHCIALPINDSVMEDDETGGISYSLFVYESVELEMSLVSTGRSDGVSSTIELLRDPSVSTRYFCYHAGGVHGISLPWIYDIKKVLETKRDGGLHEANDKPAIVQHLVCTRPLASQPAELLKGLAVCQIGLKPLLCYARSDDVDNDLETLPLACADSYSLHGSFANLSEAGTVSNGQVSNREPFIDHIKRILKKDVTNPLLKSGIAGNVSSKESFQLATRALTIFREEYLDKLLVAKEECDQRSLDLQKIQRQHAEKVQSCRNKFKEFSAKMEASEKKFQNAVNLQRSLVARVERLLRTLCGPGGGKLSEEERAAQAELQRLAQTKCSLEAQVKKIKESVAKAVAVQQSSASSASSPRSVAPKNDNASTHGSNSTAQRESGLRCRRETNAADVLKGGAVEEGEQDSLAVEQLIKAKKQLNEQQLQLDALVRSVRSLSTK